MHDHDKTKTMNNEAKTAAFFMLRDILVVSLLISIMAACVYLVHRERERQKVEEQIQEDHSKILPDVSDTTTKYPDAAK